jgi:hypothetical protein
LLLSCDPLFRYFRIWGKGSQIASTVNGTRYLDLHSSQ